MNHFVGAPLETLRHRMDDLAFTIAVIIIGTTLTAIIIDFQISEDNFHHRVACMDRFISHRNLPNSFSVQCGKLESFIARE